MTQEVIDTLPGAQDSKGKDSGLPSRCTLALAEEAGTGAGMYFAFGYQKITMQDAKIERQLIVLPSCDTFQPWQ
ncbi:RIKEN cDNA E130114P18, isoform CRA_b [Mus musculus]|uniref:RIKEN cDNA E130114P18 gene n=2 Tax=Mus TaxID=862507 RepID=A2AK51_MOUSE|nr:RIKEN cDNA E130114P18, isoform CRA_b [Mus musculus]